MENRSTATTMVGVPTHMPVSIAPVGLTGMQHADGEIHAAVAAKKFGIPFTLSTMSICSIEDIATHTQAPFWFQLYMMRDRDAMARMIERCKVAQCSALVLTLDLQVIGQRHKDIKNGLSAPPRPTLRNILNLLRHPAFADYVERRAWDVPVTLHGVPTADRVLQAQLVPYGEQDRLLLTRDVTSIERLETTRRDFVANVSHELKTPLTVLAGFLETLQELPLSAAQIADILSTMSGI
jgi:isopentenyl diphosphate isomerase/L-lactate dehydrogenase-like FMN-dependent dehydrogenase